MEQTVREVQPESDLKILLSNRQLSVLFSSILVVSVCAIIYELLISTISSYLLGSSVLHFSVTIGLFMFFMGVGSFLSKLVTEQLISRFIIIETAIGLFGGMSAFFLYLSYSVTELYYPAAFLLVAGISILAGLEIPIVTRIVRANAPLKDTLAHILSFDYVGALIGSLLFPLILIPYLGLMKSAFVIGMLNVAVALLNIKVFSPNLEKPLRYWFGAGCCAALLAGGFIYSSTLVGFFERFIYQDEIVLSRQTRYQKIVLTKFKDDVRLFLDGNIQFSSLDEHRYHESLVHIPIALAGTVEHVLILGGGDGLALREVLKHPEVRRATLVDLDAEMLDLAASHPLLRALNKGSLNDPRATIVVEDAFKFVERTADLYSVILIDLPDPNNLSLGKLYSREFYQILKKRLAGGGVLATQSSSPYLARNAFWCINQTLSEVFAQVLPYWVYVPSFGPWGFNAAAMNRLPPERITPPADAAYLTEKVLPTLFVFDNDMSKVPVETNRLDNQVLVQYYENSMEY